MSRKLNLTENQRSLWIGQSMHPTAPLYNTVYTFDFDQKIDPHLFQKAFDHLLNQTEALRLHFKLENEEPYQYIHDKVEHRLEIKDFSDNSSEEIEDWIKKRSRTLIDISKKCFDSVLIQKGDGTHTLYFNMHHLTTDAVSFRILLIRLALFYKDFEAGRTPLTENINSWSDYVNEVKETENQTEPRSINEEDSIGSKTVLNPLNFYGEKFETFSTATDRISIDLDQIRKQLLQNLSKEPEIRSWSHQLTIFNLYLTAYVAFLHRVSGERQIGVAVPSHNRFNKKFGNTVGYFIKFYPMIIQVDDEDTFQSLLRKIQIASNEYLRDSQRQEVNDEVLGQINTVFNFIGVDINNFNGIDVSTSWIHPGHMDSNHVMRFHVEDFSAKGDHKLIFDLKSSAFPGDSGTRVLDNFLDLFDAMLSDPDTTIASPELISKEEYQLLLDQNNNKTPVKNLIETLHSKRKTSTKERALISGDTDLSYEDLYGYAAAISTDLTRRGIREGDRVALHFYRSPEYVASVLALLQLGVTFIPIASDQPVERIRFMLADSESKLILVEPDLAHKLSDIALPVWELSLNQFTEEPGKPDHPLVGLSPNRLAYILYTSGSTGTPKGVKIPYLALSNYLHWALDYYGEHRHLDFPLFTSVGFDLTITSTFLPLISGGCLYVYKESQFGPDVSLLKVLEEGKVNALKLTPSHIPLIQDNIHKNSRLKTIIVGGEDFKTAMALKLQKNFRYAEIYNEYGPTEATIGCIVARFDPGRHTSASVPIGHPIPNAQVYLLDRFGHLASKGVPGELCISGMVLSQGYTASGQDKGRFVDNPFVSKQIMYRTGDMVRRNSDGELEFIGRKDEQIKLNGVRIEVKEIEANLLEHDGIDNVAVVLLDNQEKSESEVSNCVNCGLPSNFPDADFDDKGCCHLCNAFENYKDKADKYFKTESELQQLLLSSKSNKNEYDCLTLLSGGKDSTYVMARLVNMGLKVLAFTLDNGYISEQAKANIDKIVTKLGVDHIYGSTPHMNKIFVDSLQRHSNVCNGCFKTIYTLSTKIALDKKIPFIVTGLSRGQFFETRLTEELFWDSSVDRDSIDNIILEARKLYHQEEDAVKSCLDVSMFSEESTFQKVQYVDFYRYSDVSLDEMLRYLKNHVGWFRPTDTGRSTNCLINQAGIYVHKKQLGYSNYAFPYSWDVRLGHKTRNESLAEINEEINEAEVEKILGEIGFEDQLGIEDRKILVGYYTGQEQIPSKEIKSSLATKLPEYMIPSVFKFLEELPLTSNGKVDKNSLKDLNKAQLLQENSYVAPRNDIEELLEEIWKEVLQIKRIGVFDNLIELGGHSLAAIRITTRINEELQLKFPLSKLFELPTIAEYADHIEQTLLTYLED